MPVRSSATSFNPPIKPFLLIIPILQMSKLSLGGVKQATLPTERECFINKRGQKITILTLESGHVGSNGRTLGKSLNLSEHVFPKYKEEMDNNSACWEFPGSPVVKTPCFHFRGHRFDSW